MSKQVFRVGHLVYEQRQDGVWGEFFVAPSGVTFGGLYVMDDYGQLVPAPRHFR